MRLPYCLVTALFLLGTSKATEAPEPTRPPLRVLMLFPGDLLMPWTLMNADITKSAISAAVPGDIDFFAEGRDRLRMPGPDNEREFVALLRKRYEALPPDLIVFHGPMAEFAERQRAELWPGKPRMVVSAIAGTPSSAYSPDLPGTSVSYDIAGTVGLAMRLQPDARHLLVIGGGAPFSDEELALARRQLAPLRDRLDIEYLTSGAPAELEQRVAAVSHDSMILHLAILRPTRGAMLVPQVLARQVMAVSGAPSYSHYDVMLGQGSVGGSLANWAGQKDMIGRIAADLLRGGPGAAPRGLQPPVVPVCRVDWRQLQHWKLRPENLPKDCEVLFQPVPFWQQYRREATAIVIALAIQTALIVALLFQRRRRRVAELELLHQGAQLTHAARLATVGELSASIAHEVNQPLAAILSNAEAGEQLIRSGNARTEDLQEILTSIRDDDIRASEVVQRMRKLLRQEPNEMRPMGVNEAVESILRLTRGIVKRNEVEIACDLDPHLPKIQGDFVQIQQVLMNLVVNAVEAMSNTPEGQRRLTITTAQRTPGNVEVSVRDSGPGIPADKLQRLFDPFYTTKAEGMGLGLPITRTILRAHKGEIEAASTGTGALFRVTIPAIRVAH